MREDAQPASTAASATALGGWQGVGFDGIMPGTARPARRFTSPRAALRRVRACLGQGDAPPGPQRVPAFLLNEFTTAKQGLRFPPGVLHASEEITCHQPVMTDEPLLATVRIQDATTRSGKRFVVMAQAVHRAGAEAPAVTITRTLFWPC